MLKPTNEPRSGASPEMLLRWSLIKLGLLAAALVALAALTALAA